MIIRRVDENGDFVFGHGLADYLTQNEAIELLLRQRLWLWLGEWFLDITAGVNWPAILGTRPPALRLAETEIRRIILDTPGVVRITAFDMNFDHRTFMVTIVVRITTEFSTDLEVTTPVALVHNVELTRRVYGYATH